ncbi:MAG: hypothetical protein QOE58_1646, partial [Actinomycetota bacterium]|nr:hypothetical protein [Actinomycetota bacterium]
LVPLLLLVVLFAIALVWWLPRSRRTLDLDPSRQVALLAGYRKAVGWRWAGFGLGVVVACVTAATVRVGLYNLGAMLAPTVFGLCVTGGVVVGELKTIPPRQGIRTAALEPRTIGHYLPKWLGGLVAASSLGLGALLVMTTLMGSAEAVVAAAGVMVAASLSGVAFVAGMGLHRAACAPAVGAPSWTFLSVALLGVGSLMLPVAAWCLALLLAGPRISVAQSGDTLTEQPIRR